jgi:hypothetical protein
MKSFPSGCISFPKSGRTWLRLMLDDLKIHLQYSHAGADHAGAKHFSQLDTSTAPRFRKIVFLHRDPRDTVVSGYHQASKRIGVFQGSISEFVRDPHHGIEKVARFNRMWLGFANDNPLILVCSYEAMLADTGQELKRIVAFLGASVYGKAIEDAVCRNRFEEMRRREASGEFREKYGQILTPRDSNNPDSFKVRRGVVGGYRDELSSADIAYCDDALDALGVSFQEVVHSARTEKAEVVEASVIFVGPNEHPQECPSDASASRGDGPRRC